MNAAPGVVEDLDMEQLKELIKYETEVLKFTALVTVGTAGGSIGLLLGEATPIRLGLAGAGFLLTLILIVASWRMDQRIRALIAQLKEAP